MPSHRVPRNYFKIEGTARALGSRFRMVCVNMRCVSGAGAGPGSVLHERSLLTSTPTIPPSRRGLICKRGAEVQVSGVMQILWNARGARAEWTELT